MTGASGRVQRSALVAGYGAARAAIGASLAVAPTATTRAWLGPPAGEPAVRLAVRLMGLRDLVLGVAIAARARTGDVAGLAAAGAVADAGDLVVTVANRAWLPRSATAVAAVASAGVGTGATLAWWSRRGAGARYPTGAGPAAVGPVRSVRVGPRARARSSGGPPRRRRSPSPRG